MATFEDGPRNGPRPRMFVAASVPGSGPAEPWPGQIEFVLDPDRSDLGASGEDWGTAVYVFADPEDPPGP